MTSEPILVRKIESVAELKTVQAHIHTSYGEYLGIFPPAPDYLFAAFKAAQLCGTIGLMVARESHPLRLLRIYDIDAGLPQASELVEFCRWTSGDMEVSAALIHEAARFARCLGKTHGLCEHGPAVHRAARRLGISFEFISSKIRFERCESWSLSFYERHRPALYLINLEQTAQATAAQCGSLRRRS
jgi:hypothetical protein